MIRKAIEMSNFEEEERKKRSAAEESLESQLKHATAAEAEIIR